jgi:hypothetical protein
MIPAQRSSILVIALILLHLAGFSQEKKYVKKNLTWTQNKVADTLYTPKPQPQSIPRSSPYFLLQSMPAGFFCVQEYKLEKWTGLPIKFRLGTYDVAHRLEYGR